MLEGMTAYLGRPPAEALDMDTGAGAALQPPTGFTPPDYSVYHPDRVHGQDGFTIDANGCGHLSHGFYHFTERISPLCHPTRLDELEAYPIPPRDDWSDAAMRAAATAAHAEGRHAQVFVGHMYENAWQVRGYEPFLEDLLLRRDWAEAVLDKFAHNNRLTATAAACAGYDCIATGDDLVEIGVTILNPVQPECMDARALRRRFGRRLAFDGCVGTQTTFPFGTSQDVRAAVRGYIDDLDGLRGGLMLAPTHVLEPEVPPENVAAFFAACDGG